MQLVALFLNELSILFFLLSAFIACGGYLVFATSGLHDAHSSLIIMAENCLENRSFGRNMQLAAFGQLTPLGSVYNYAIIPHTHATNCF